MGLGNITTDIQGKLLKLSVLARFPEILKNSCVRLCVLEQEQECSEHVEHALIVYATC